MKPNITINDPGSGVLLTNLCVGDFFRFPASAEGSAYILSERVYHKGEILSHVNYIKLDTGSTFIASPEGNKRVNKLRLVSATFDLERGL